MTGVPIVCPDCDGKKGYSNIDSTWVVCEQCDGKGWVDEDELEDDDKEDEDDE